MNREQLLAILWLRWRLSANQFSRGSKLNAVFSVVVIALGTLGAAGSAMAGLSLGFFITGKVSPLILLVGWHVIILILLLLWFTGLLMQIQRSESVDLTRLLHLPVRLKQVFAFNYLLSLLTPSFVLLAPGMLGFCLGFMLRRGPAMLLMALLVVGFLFMLSAWTYCLRGWLAGLMVNKRRRQSVIVWVTLVFVLVFQIPNFLAQTGFFKEQRRPGHGQAGKSGALERLPPRLMPLHLLVPPAWVGYGSMRLLEGDPLPAVGGVLASGLLGAWGIGRAYRITLRFYQGGGEAPVTFVKPKPEKGVSRMLVERRLPWLDEETSALALACLRCLLRSPELKMALLMPVFALVGGYSALHSGSRHLQNELVMGGAGSGAVLLGIFSLAAFAANTFGMDRGGFRALVLLPTARWRILLAKNLALLPLSLAMSSALLAVVAVVLRFPWDLALACAAQFVTGFCVFLAVNNWLACLFAYRIKPGTLQASKATGSVFVGGLATVFLMPLTLAVLLVPMMVQTLWKSAGWAPGLPLNLVLSFIAALVCAWGYARLLPVQGRLLQKRELTILRQVTEELE